MSNPRVPSLTLRKNLARNLLPSEVDKNFEILRDHGNAMSERLGNAVAADGTIIVPTDTIIPRHVKSYVDEYTAEAVTIDWATGTAFKVNGLVTEVTISFTNVKSGQKIEVLVTNSGGAITFPATVQWVGGRVPIPSAELKNDMYRFIAFGDVVFGEVLYDFGTTYVPIENRWDYILATEEKTSGTSCGDASAGRNIRTVAEKVDAVGNVAIDANGYMVFRAGTYVCRIVCPAWNTSSHQAYLMRYVNDSYANENDDKILLRGTAVHGLRVNNGSADIAYAHPHGSETAYVLWGPSASHIMGQFVIPDDDDPDNRKVYIGHWFKSSATDGLGLAAATGPYGKKEVYTIAEFWRIL